MVIVFELHQTAGEQTDGQTDGRTVEVAHRAL
jgi:hypothetical protein